jgi:hypothetical protein
MIHTNHALRETQISLCTRLFVVSKTLGLTANLKFPPALLKPHGKTRPTANIRKKHDEAVYTAKHVGNSRQTKSLGNLWPRGSTIRWNWTEKVPSICHEVSFLTANSTCYLGFLSFDQTGLHDIFYMGLVQQAVFRQLVADQTRQIWHTAHAWLNLFFL